MQEHPPRIVPVDPPNSFSPANLLLAALKNLSGFFTVLVFALLFALGAAFIIWIGHYQSTYNIGFLEFIKMAITF